MHPLAPSHIPLSCGPSGPGTDQLEASPAPGHRRHRGPNGVPPSWHLPLPLGCSTLLSLISSPEKWDDSASCRDLAGPACTLLSDTQQDLIQDAHVPDPVPGRWGSGLDSRVDIQTELPVLMQLTLRAVVLQAGAVRSPGGHQARWRYVWFSQSWGRACSWPLLGGGHGLVTRRTGTPRELPSPKHPESQGRGALLWGETVDQMNEENQQLLDGAES